MRFARTFALAAVSGLAACAPDLSGPADQIPLQARAASQLALAAQGSSARGFEDEILRMETRIPGLGGVSVDPATQQPIVYLKDLGSETAAMAELRNTAPTLAVDAVFRGKLGVEGVTSVRQGAYAFSELVAIEQMVSERIRLPGVQSVDADEGLNRVRLTVNPGADQASFLDAIATAGLPVSAVVIDSHPLAISASTLRDKIRPTAAGLQIAFGSGLICTMGFNVDMQFYHKSGFLTASHCDTGAMGHGNTGVEYDQNTLGAANIIGSSMVNPAWNSTSGDCRGYTLCTGADAMFVLNAYTDSTWTKQIASTQSTGTSNHLGSIVINGYWNGISIVPYIYQGAIVYKQGRTTGQVSGPVAATCENPLIDSAATNQHVVLCAYRVSDTAWGTGDSGGPVFYPNAGTDPPYAIGIMFAGYGSAISNPNPNDFGTQYCYSSCNWYFSDFYAIQSHLNRYFDP